MKYYTTKKIDKRDAHYNLIFGERSNGKTTALLLKGLQKWWDTGEEMAYVRRYDVEIRGKQGDALYNAIRAMDSMSKITGGEWNDIYYYNRKWWARLIEDGKEIKRCETPFAYAFSLSGSMHDKSTSFPKVTTIVFDEFLSRDGYLSDEFILFMNLISTIVRERKNVKIYMLGNTVNKYCPYFKEMGLTHIKDMEQGTIDLYTYGNSELKVAVEYCGNLNKDKPSDVYFAFNNPHLQMIKTGSWEMDIYPHCPTSIAPKDIIYKFYIDFEGELLEGDVVRNHDNIFLFFHRKTTPLKEYYNDLIYTQKYDMRQNYRRKITKPVTRLEQKIIELFAKDKVFYQDNEVGEIVRNYLQWCKQ